MIAGARGMDAVFGEEDFWFLLEGISGIGCEEVDEFDVLRVSSFAEDISLSERSAPEIALEPSGKQRSRSDIAVSEQDDMLMRNTIRPVEYGGELPFELGWGTEMPDIVAADADDDEIVAGAAYGLECWQEVSDTCAVLGPIVDGDLRDIVGELAGECVFGSVGAGTNRGTVAEDENFFERIAMLHGKSSRLIG